MHPFASTQLTASAGVFGRAETSIAPFVAIDHSPARKSRRSIRGFKLAAYRVAGRGDFTREFSYEDATGALKVHDSDPFASGKEEKTPRVIDRTITVAAAAGGCSSLEVTPKSGAAGKVEDAPLVGKVFTRLSAFFPELRK